MSGDGTVGKAMDVLDQVAAFGRPVRFAALLEASPFPKATLYRFLQTLTNQRLLAYDPDHQTYSVGVRLVRLAHAAWNQTSIAPIARPHLDALSHKIGLTVHLAQLDNGQVLYVDKRNAAKPVEMFSDAGKIGPAYCTGVGKAMLAYLPPAAQQQALAKQSYHIFTDQTLASPEAVVEELSNIVARGHAYDREEHEPGIICIGVPILSGGGVVLGGLSITGATPQMTYDKLDALVPDLQRAATAIAIDVETWRSPTHLARSTGRETNQHRTGTEG
ncbi:HTH-type transcriptional regulator, IclR family [Sulfitobacter noctilucicola]|uniref:DNA-binding IclR family transcriptional regulator n=1 Tax=Sulfitobacter noctilucicola TaxID=1342301 RepID=A0A7W6MC93_9RHOB|nr:IclR family transcriptional regulator [Sulfitobacter noctilucicola]KIN66238.1 HTH-type transcriptional regulator, IclR family [Sulfitobacter noctilucicola]MBB4175592.1 DNA-binding IclR family transcriptional regulator [Sulfitobacter noctilucicola]